MNVPWRDRRGRFLPLKASVLILMFVPGMLSAYWYATGELGGRPLHELILNTGLWTIRFFLISLAITPIRSVLQWPQLLMVRRTVGVTAMIYGLIHLSLFVVDKKGQLLVVVSEIALRFYLTIGLIALLGLVALGTTSTDAAVRRMGRGWKRLHRLSYPIAVLAILHYFIQAKANVSEPVFVAGLYVWLMAWRALPASWQRPAAIYPALAIIAGFATAGIEFAWYSLATHINAWRVLMANESVSFGLRPAHWVVIVTLTLTALIIIRRMPSLPRRRLIPLRIG
ncbi:MAG: sulfoxide reductase heme-binding subunit YedZ [Acetobacteraceae bacterium]|nr:sulfoxide reductase heme-binding subunit YedZ [Acetobacteraceae bacterium]